MNRTEIDQLVKNILAYGFGINENVHIISVFGVLMCVVKCCKCAKLQKLSRSAGVEIPHDCFWDSKDYYVNFPVSRIFE